ncbi:MAG: DUF1934 domain-containing protein [Acetatifactor sp.]|nr:DUF1934 domain-containing protein [Acetatifactor sp.]
MNHLVQLTLVGRQRDPSGNETVTELSANAEFYERNGSLYILYEEKSEDGSLTKNVIKHKNNLLELTKKGAVNTCMVFEPGREYKTDYLTPFGLLRLGILTNSLKSQRQKDYLEITADYTLTEQERIISYCNIYIKIQNLG